MKTAMKSAWRSAAGIVVAAIACGLALACALALPATVHAVDATRSNGAEGAEDLVVSQTFKTTGTVPDSVTDTFSYELSATTSDAPVPGGTSPYTFELTGDNASKTIPVAFGSSSGGDAFVFLAAGVFEYDVECTTVGDDALKVDTIRYHISISIVDDEAADDGLRLDKIVVKNVETGDKPNGIEFNHAYTASAMFTVGYDPPVRKSIEGGTPASNATFRFLFKADDPSYPMPEGSSNGQKTVQVVGAGEVKIGDIAFTEPGEYTYTVTEIDDGVAGYTYDKTEYKITFTITAEVESNSRALGCKIMKDGQEINDIVAFDFTNQYAGKKANPIQRVINKIMPKTGDSTWMMTVISAILVIGVATALVAYAAMKRHRRNGE